MSQQATISSFIQSDLVDSQFNGYSLSNRLIEQVNTVSLPFQIDDIPLDHLFSLSRYVLDFNSHLYLY